MKNRIFNMATLLVVGAILFACSDDESSLESRLSVSDFYPAIVMEGTEVTVTGTGMSEMTEVIFPGGIVASEKTLVDERTLKVITPTGITDASEPLILRDNDDEVESRQMMRKAQPTFKSYLFSNNEGALLKTNITIQGNDLLMADKVTLFSEEESLELESLNFIRKSNTDIKFMIPKEAPVGKEVHVKLVFKNGTELALPDLEVIDGDIPDDFRDPVTPFTIMLNDFEMHDNHDPNACIFNNWWNPKGEDGECAAVIRTDEWDGNQYLYYQKDLSNWTLHCGHFDIGSVENIENYVFKLDVRIEEGTFSGPQAIMQAVIADKWVWIGGNYFPETTDGAWITVTRNLPADWNGTLEIGTKPNGFFGGPVPAGVCIDNFRLDPKN